MKKFEEPILEVATFAVEDIITVSGPQPEDSETGRV